MTIKCPNCGEEISEYAHTCPHCGAENTERKSFSDIDIEDDDYESKYFSYAPIAREQEEAEKKRKNTRFMIITFAAVAAVVIITLVAVLWVPIRGSIYESQLENDREVLETCKETLSASVNNGTVRVSSKMADYIDNGPVKAFGLKWNVSIELSDGYSERVKLVTLECTKQKLRTSAMYSLRDEVDDACYLVGHWNSLENEDRFVWNIDKDRYQIIFINPKNDDGNTKITIGLYGD